MRYPVTRYPVTRYPVTRYPKVRSRNPPVGFGRARPLRNTNSSRRRMRIAPVGQVSHD
jgi:hypothetical protein